MNDEVDINKIVDFINSDPNEETNVTDVENTIEYIDNQLAAVKQESKQIKTEEQADQQQHTINELVTLALNEFSKVDTKTDEIYEIFKDPIAIGKDRTDASKVALLDSQRIKVEMINALAGLANAQAKLEMARSKMSTGANLLINAQSGSEVGVSLHNLWEAAKEEQ